jgi:putative transferase (TIGR04331 family)
VFLATTALSEFWNKNEEILFLGNWCRRGSRRAEWEGLEYKVLPSPWDDRDRFYEAARYVDGLYERLLRNLAEYLNAVNGQSYSHRYWRIVLGPWLLHFLHQFYDRYSHLLDAFRLDPHLQTLVPELQSFLGITDAKALASVTINDGDATDYYNLQICSQILSGMGKKFPTRVPEALGQCEPAASDNEHFAFGTVGRWALHQAYEKIGRALLRLGCQGIVFCHMMGGSAVPLKAVPKLWRKGIRIVPFKLHVERPLSVWNPEFDSKRKGLATLPSQDEFERIFVQFLPNNFPTRYLECFPSWRTRVLQHCHFPAAILSAVGWYYDEEFKLFAAEAVEKKSTRLLAAQHGGGYGQLRYVPHERHEVKLADRFMVWGWANGEDRSVQNLPNPILSARYGRQFRKSPESDSVLFVSDENPRYVYRLQTSQIATQMEAYIEWKLRFLDAIPSMLRKQIMMRPHPAVIDHPCTLQERIGCKWPEVRWDEQHDFVKLLERTRVAVIDYCGGPLLEALAANVPTLAFWDPKRWEVRDEAQPYFDDLRKVGILWDSPEAAAVKLAVVYDTVESWWASEATQDARQRFADRYALTHPDWVEPWSQALREEVSVSRHGMQENHCQ